MRGSGGWVYRYNWCAGGCQLAMSTILCASAFDCTGTSTPWLVAPLFHSSWVAFSFYDNLSTWAGNGAFEPEVVLWSCTLTWVSGGMLCRVSPAIAGWFEFMILGSMFLSSYCCDLCLWPECDDEIRHWSTYRVCLELCLLLDILFAVSNKDPQWWAKRMREQIWSMTVHREKSMSSNLPFCLVFEWAKGVGIELEIFEEFSNGPNVRELGDMKHVSTDWHSQMRSDLKLRLWRSFRDGNVDCWRIHLQMHVDVFPIKRPPTLLLSIRYIHLFSVTLTIWCWHYKALPGWNSSQLSCWNDLQIGLYLEPNLVEVLSMPLFIAIECFQIWVCVWLGWTIPEPGSASDCPQSWGEVDLCG